MRRGSAGCSSPGYEFVIPGGEEHCWAWLTDAANSTADPSDDMSPECTEDDRPCEVKIARRPGEFPPGYYWQLRCRPCD